MSAYLRALAVLLEDVVYGGAEFLSSRIVAIDSTSGGRDHLASPSRGWPV
jgi:hypothetical protein